MALSLMRSASIRSAGSRSPIPMPRRGAHNRVGHYVGATVTINGWQNAASWIKTSAGNWPNTSSPQLVPVALNAAFQVITYQVPAQSTSNFRLRNFNRK